MKTILKRNQLVILVIALVLVTAGYLNYTSMNENNENTVMTSQIVAELGDATLVSSTDIENEEVEKSGLGNVIKKSIEKQNNNDFKIGR